LSCGRLHLLERSINAVVTHMETSEPDLPYEIVWVDNGSPPHELAAARRRLPPIEKLAALGANNGIAFGLNTAFFRLCSAPYIVSLEEDWAFAALAPPLATPARERILEHSIAIIDGDSGIAGVILRNETYDQFTAPRGWLRAAAADGVEVEYRHYCAPIAGGVVYGAYTNGASIYARERLMSIGSGIYGEPENAVGFPPSYSEANYATRVALKYPCSAMIRTRTDCEVISCMGVFEHIGEGQSIMSAQTNADLARGQNISWVLYDTPLFGRLHEIQLKRA
jgi:hypothetical protein